ncbi:MAG: AGE family epimerase/isomerase [Ahrensia sp.]|nr:AGE family epimerase/isomerase [Ahrensia sp.]
MNAETTPHLMPEFLDITPVILCGGAGSRLWPMSRDEKPKQFHPLFNEKSLLANTVMRTPEGDFGEVHFRPHCILGSASLVAAFQNEILSFDSPTGRIFLEPSVRDTAAAIAAVTAAMVRDDPDMLLLVLPSDARIDDHEEFRKAITKAARTAKDHDAIMTIGIAPTRPETQYGYIERGQVLGDGFAVSKFKEKPSLEVATDYVASGQFVWNAGMFLFRAGRMADEFSKLQPLIWQHAKAAVENAVDDGLMLHLSAPDFNAAPKLSMDYAIMEKAGNIGVVPAQFDWDDLGSWPQLYDAAPKDNSGNACVGDVVLVAASNNFVRTDNDDNGMLVALGGVDGLTVIAEDNKVLIVPTAKAQLTKDIKTAFAAQYGERDACAKGDKAAIKKWLFEQALPLWASNGIDLKNGGAHEALNFDGSVAAHHTKKRLRVTARQIYCYAHASMMGWQSPDEKASADYVLRHLLATLIDTGWHKSEGGFIHLYNPDGTVQDDTRDTYDQCFVLLGLAWLHRAKGWPEARAWADKTLAYMDAYLSDPIHGGYFENNRKDKPRRANPHMHFLEAMLGWYEATGEEDYLNRAQKIVTLFERHFFDAPTGTLTERFNDDWSVNPDHNTDIEPGHHYEWAWLLMRYNKLRPTKDLSTKARTLYATAHAFGHHGKTRAVALTIAQDGSTQSNDARCWSQTEALKAAIIFEQEGLASAAHLRSQMMRLLFTRYLSVSGTNGAIAGGWYDAIDKTGQPSAPDMPASTFYHVFCALAFWLDEPLGA